MDKKLKSILTDLGLSENEADVYLAALSAGSSTILKIAKIANVKRTTVYPVVETLKQKGLISEELKGWKKLYAPVSPLKLSSILEARREKLKNALPEFMSMYNLKGNESFIKYYEGREAIKSLYDEILKELRPGDFYFAISNEDNWISVDEKYFKNFILRRSKLNVKIKLLLQNTPSAKKHLKSAKNLNEELKILPEGENFTSSFTIIPRKIILHQTKPAAISLVVENQSIVRMQKELFEMAWKLIK